MKRERINELISDLLGITPRESHGDLHYEICLYNRTTLIICSLTPNSLYYDNDDIFAAYQKAESFRFTQKDFNERIAPILLHDLDLALRRVQEVKLEIQQEELNNFRNNI